MACHDCGVATKPVCTACGQACDACLEESTAAARSARLVLAEWALAAYEPDTDLTVFHRN